MADDLTREQMLIARAIQALRHWEKKTGWRSDVLDDLEAYLAEFGMKVTPRKEAAS